MNAREMPKIAGFSFADGGGGAAKAAYRLHSAFRREGADAYLHVLRKESDDPSVIPIAAQARLGTLAGELAPRLDQLPLKLFHRGMNSFFSTGWYGAIDPADLRHVLDADVICLYWVTRGLLGIKQIGQLLSTGKPVIWRLSDMWPFTGGCHYSGDCQRFKQACGQCPQLKSHSSIDLSGLLLKSKAKRWAGGNLTIVAPSHWMAEKAKSSRLFGDRDIRVIATGVDCSIFRPYTSKDARKLLNLPLDQPLLLLGASDALKNPRKGSGILAHIFNNPLIFASAGDNLPGLVIFGASQRPDTVPPHIPVYLFGKIHDEILLSLIYSACDVFIAPSREENLANTVLEAMSCGLPIVAYRIGGMPEAVEHERNGLLFSGDDESGFSLGVAKILADSALREKMSMESRMRACKCFDLYKQAGLYLDLYSELCRLR